MLNFIQHLTSVNTPPPEMTTKRRGVLIDIILVSFDEKVK